MGSPCLRRLALSMLIVLLWLVGVTWRRLLCLSMALVLTVRRVDVAWRLLVRLMVLMLGRGIWCVTCGLLWFIWLMILMVRLFVSVFRSVSLVLLRMLCVLLVFLLVVLCGRRRWMRRRLNRWCRLIVTWVLMLWRRGVGIVILSAVLLNLLLCAWVVLGLIVTMMSCVCIVRMLGLIRRRMVCVLSFVDLCSSM